MANQEHLDILKHGVDEWNKWRKKHPHLRPDLIGADLSKIRLSGANLSDTDLSSAVLIGVNFGEVVEFITRRTFSRAMIYMPSLGRAVLFGSSLSSVDFRRADLQAADLSRAFLTGSDFTKANLRGAGLNGTLLNRAKLNEADLSYADLSEADLSGTDLNGAKLSQSEVEYTIFGNVDLSTVKGLETVKHRGPSTIDIDTIYNSQGNIPEIFLKGAGVDDAFITYIRSLVGKAIEYYSCFISYSSKDEAFAKRLYADLQNNNVRCWFAQEDMKIGDKFRHRIDESIRIYDKLLIVLSEASLASTWVGYEVERALNKEPEGKPNVLFPIRLDKAILACETDWAKDIRKTRHIGDFEHWKDHDAYQVAFERLLRDLKAQS